jgi:hypothetical protein
MRKKRSTNGNGVAGQFEMIRQKSHGNRFTVFCCMRCTRAWRFREPVESWRLANLLKHSAGHDEVVTAAMQRAYAGEDAGTD